jgi:non-specific protein-tyrosine kinase
MSRLKKALERAKETRETYPDGAIQERKNSFFDLRPPEKDRKAARRDVNIDYSETKVLSVDHHHLRKNKIFTVSHNNELSDQMKILRTLVLDKLEEIGGNSLLVTSAHQGEGKTFTSINLGVSIAQELDRTTLIVDADLRNPSTSHYDFANDFFGVEVNRGLADYLLGDVEISELLLNPGIQKLTILPAGRHLENSAELLNSPRMESLVTEMKNRYRQDRIIIFDGPSILTCTDPAVMSRFVDGVLVVVEAERTLPGDLKRVMEFLDGKPIIGTLLNKAI